MCSLPFPSLPFPSLPFPFLPFPSFPFIFLFSYFSCLVLSCGPFVSLLIQAKTRRNKAIRMIPTVLPAPISWMSPEDFLHELRRLDGVFQNSCSPVSFICYLSCMRCVVFSCLVSVVFPLEYVLLHRLIVLLPWLILCLSCNCLAIAIDITYDCLAFFRGVMPCFVLSCLVSSFLV